MTLKYHLHKIKPLHWLVWQLIKFGFCHNKGKFKPGDLVKYNWKAWTYIHLAIDLPKRGILVVEGYSKWSKDQSHCEYTRLNDPTHDIKACDTFWLRRIYWWESIGYSKSKFADWLFNTFGKKVEEKHIIGMDSDHTIKKAWVLSIFGRVYTRYVATLLVLLLSLPALSQVKRIPMSIDTGRVKLVEPDQNLLWFPDEDFKPLTLRSQYCFDDLILIEVPGRPLIEFLADMQRYLLESNCDIVLALSESSIKKHCSTCMVKMPLKQRTFREVLNIALLNTPFTYKVVRDYQVVIYQK
jgi:hypothetical protein